MYIISTNHAYRAILSEASTTESLDPSISSHRTPTSRMGTLILCTMSGCIVDVSVDDVCVCACMSFCQWVQQEINCKCRVDLNLGHVKELYIKAPPTQVLWNSAQQHHHGHADEHEPIKLKLNKRSWRSQRRNKRGGEKELWKGWLFVSTYMITWIQ